MNELIGYIGAFLSAITFMPQVWQAYKTKSVGDLSIYMILIVVLSTIIWLYYGISTGSGPVIAANAIVMLLSLVLLYFKLTFKKSSQSTLTFKISFLILPSPIIGACTSSGKYIPN